MKNTRRYAALALTGVLGISTLAGSVMTVSAADKIRVASKDFTENEIVAEIYALALEDAGFEVERIFDVSSAIIHESQISNEIDIYPEYTGTGLISILGLDPITDPQEVYDTVKDEFEKQFSITWLEYSEANDGQGLFIRTEAAEKYGIKTISDLQEHTEELRFASQGEFDERADGIPALEAVYGELNWKSSKVYDNSLKYQVLANDEADVAPAYTTEGRLTEEQFTLLEDDKQVWPPYNLAPVVRDEVLNANPEIADVLNKVSAALTTENITELNAQVDIEGEEYADVAAAFYDTLK
ncbi:MAG: glycine betaine ABC transporter substrate-binding protein [Lachnospiraceae bacterium]|nr:glycine betaine ABC transporter substrate-binding protein [Lachnospiraceae bacterium]